VVILSAEDGIADTIKPRLRAMGGDVERVHVIQGVKNPDDVEQAFKLDRDLPALEDTIVEKHAVLVIIDPLAAYLGGKDSHRDADIRGVLGPLAALADRTSVAVLGIAHLTKDQERKVLYRTLGSIAFVAAPRVVLTVARDHDDQSRRY